MRQSRAGRIILTILAYVFSTFVVQGTSHFVVNADHYRGIPIMREQPVVALGFTAMLIQGAIMALLFPSFNRSGSPIRNGVVFSLSIGLFLASFIALGAAGEYAVPSIPRWVATELISAAVQFTLFGILLGLIHAGARSEALQSTA